MSGRSIAVEVRRAALASVDSGASIADAASEAGVAPGTLRRWVRRRADPPVERDRARRGRPRIQETADDVVAAVLAPAGGRIGGAEYASRAIAESTGLSQTVVARAMRALAARPERPGLRLVRFAVADGAVAIGVEPIPEADTGRARGRGVRSHMRRSAGVLAALRSAGIAGWRGHGEPVGEIRGARSPEDVRTYDDGTTLLAALREVLAAVDDIPGPLLHRLAAATGAGLDGLRWSAEEGASEISMTSDSFDALGASPWIPRSARSDEERVIALIADEIIVGGFGPGDRVRAQHLAERVDRPLRTVDAAVVRMVDEELLAVDGGGLRVPAITAADVLDLYAARQALGRLLLRALLDRPRRHLVPLRIALRRVEEHAAARNDERVGDADLRFQQELARASGLVQTARAFDSLTLRLRLYISVLRLDYRPAADRIVHDDRRILHAVQAGDRRAVESAWAAKVDNAVRHMTAMAGRRGFDTVRWALLTGPDGE